MTNASRLKSDGTLLVNGIFDEVTYNSTAPVIKNLVTYSQDLTQWTKLFDTVAPTVTTSTAIPAPNFNGGITSFTANNSTAWLTSPNSIAVNAGNNYVFSVYAHADTQSSFFILLYASFYTTVSSPNVTVSYNLANQTMVNGGGALVNSYGMDSIGNGWYRCWMNATCTKSGIGGNHQYIRTGYVSGNMYFWGYQIEQVATTTSNYSIYQGIDAANTLVSPGFVDREANDGSSYVTNIFDEVTYNSTAPAIKNLLTYTEQRNNAIWLKGSVTITADSTTDPIGTTTADTIVENTTPAAYHFTNQQGITKSATSVTYTYSVYAKDAGRTGFGLSIFNINGTGGGAVVAYNLSTGATITAAGVYSSYVGNSVSSTIKYVGNGWYRISLTTTTDASATNIGVQNYLYSIPAATTVYTGDGVSGVYVWGAQMELGSAATVYQGIAAANTLVSPGFVKRVSNDGTSYVTNIFDEVTGAPIVDSSLVLWLDAQQPGSYPGTGTTWTDLSGNSNNATLSGTYTYNQTSINFISSGKGLVNYASSNLSLITSSTGVTVSIWTRVSSIPNGSYNRLFSVGDYPSQNYYLEFNGVTLGTLLSFVGGSPLVTNQVLSTGTWYNIVQTYDGSLNSIYINGILSKSVGANGSISTTTTYLGIFSDPTVGSNTSGEVSIFSMYKRALSAAEISTNFNALRGRYNV